MDRDSGNLNTVWVLLCSYEQIVASQIAITASLIALAAAWRNAALSAPSALAMTGTVPRSAR